MSLSVALFLAAPARAADPVSMSIEDALRQAQSTSEAIEIARSQRDQAEGDRWQARSGFLPQISGSLTYQRTFASEFDNLSFGGGPIAVLEPCDPVAPVPPCQIVPETTGESAALPFGQDNTWRAGITVQQGIFGGGRAGALYKIAGASTRSADVAVESARASSALGTASAYYDAALSDRLFEIASGSLSQAEGALKQTELAEGVGRQPEFDLLRARVVVDNQKVAVINARRQQEVAHQRLLQLVNLPPETPLTLTSPLEGTDVTPLAVDLTDAPETGGVRATVRQLSEAATISQAGVAVARADALPSLGASVSVGWVAYPKDLFPFGGDTDWTPSSSASVALSVPLLNGGRLWGAYQKARGVAAQSAAQLSQTAELASLDARSTETGLEAASAQWTATEGVVEQARRAYEIAELRFTEGVSTQLELSDARLQLEQALVNRAQAARDLAVAKIRVALLPSLPLTP